MMKRGRVLFKASVWILSILSLLFCLFPYYIMLINSFKTQKELFASTLSFPETFLVLNYVRAIERMDLFTTLLNSLLITVFSTIVIVLFGSMTGYALNRVKSRMSDVIFNIFLAAVLIPFQSVMIPLVVTLADIGILNTRVGMVFTYLGFGCSMCIFLVYGALKSIPLSLDEAGIIDGAKRSQVFFRIIFPMLKPTMITSAVLNVLWIWNDYLLPSLVINQENLHTIPLRLYYFFAEYTKEWNYAMAGLVLSTAPVIVFYLFCQKYIIKGISDGAIKQ